jgi:putative transposase
MKKIVKRFGKNIKIVNDNGSENMKDLEDFLVKENITRYRARPYTPKDKAFIERFIGTFQRECLDYNYAPMNVRELSEVVDERLYKYRFYRPHAAPGFLTPAEFSSTPGLHIHIP